MLTIVEASRRIRSRDMTSAQLVEDALLAIAREQARTNAFIRVDAEGARRAAGAADAELARGIDRGPLHGIPVSLKDLIDVAGTVTSAASRVLADRLAPRDAAIVGRLREAGAVLIGKTNLHEFALGTTSEDSAFGPVRNPHDTSRSAGGSSGGSAVAVATGMGLASIGTDTGGSIRIPAAACGVVGLKPAYGEVPTDGIIPLSHSFDHAGPLARSVEDAAILWAILSGRQPASVQQDVREAAATCRPRLVRLRGYFDSPIDPAVRARFDSALDACARAGCTIADAELPGAHGIMEAYVSVVLAEGAAWHGRFLDSRGADYSPIVRARFESGRNITAVAYLQARQFCTELAAVVRRTLADADALVLPTLPILPPPLGADELTIDPAEGDRTPVRSAMLKHTQPFNMTGVPAISLPAPGAGLPVGVQLVALDTSRLLAIATACEKIFSDAQTRLRD
jgi:aspartyl-tRNA(Asn)/glutamyl-tRNA(Gln) amidotransferase subunit A